MRKDVLNIRYIKEDKRFDGSFFLNDNALNSRVVQIHFDKCLPLSVLSKVFNPPVFKRQFCKKSVNSVPYCQSSAVTNMLEGSNVFINKQQALSTNTIVKENQILVSGFGTIGSCRIVNSLSAGIAYANNVCRIEANENQKCGYLYAFLSSKYGFGQLNKNASGSVVRYIEAPGIKKTLIPILPDSLQSKIHNLIVQSTDLRVQANELIRESHNTFIGRLKIAEKRFELLNSFTEKSLGNVFIRNKSSISSTSLRSRNYSIRKSEIIKALKTSDWDELVNVLEQEPFYGARFKRIESNSKNGLQLLSQGDLFDISPQGRIVSVKNIKNVQHEIVKKGTIVIPGQGTLGENEIFAKAQYIWGYLEGRLIAGHAMRFIPSQKIPSGYLYCVLSSPLWFRLLRNSVYGTNLLGFIIPMINKYPIPRFESEFELLIHNKINKAFDNLTLAIESEKLAIELIENELILWQN